MTASLHKSLGLFSVFWPFTTMLNFGWSPLVLRLPSSPVPCNNPLVTVPNAPITIGVIVTFMFHSFFSSLARLRYLAFCSLSVFSVVSRYSKVHNFGSYLFLLIIIRPGLLAEIWWLVCMSKSHRSLCVSFSRTAAGLCIYYFFVWSNLSL